MTKPIQIEGLRDVQKALRAADPERKAQRKLRLAGNKVAERIVLDGRRRASTKMERAAAETLRAQSGQRYAAVKLGRKRVGFALGAEFGAYRTNRRRRSPRSGYPTSWQSYRGYAQFKPHRGSGESAGYFMWPAIRAARPVLADEYLAAIEAVLLEEGMRP